MTREDIREWWTAHKAEQRAWRKRPLRQVAIPEVKQYGSTPPPWAISMATGPDKPEARGKHGTAKRFCPWRQRWVTVGRSSGRRLMARKRAAERTYDHELSQR